MSDSFDEIELNVPVTQGGISWDCELGRAILKTDGTIVINLEKTEFDSFKHLLLSNFAMGLTIEPKWVNRG